MIKQRESDKMGSTGEKGTQSEDGRLQKTKWQANPGVKSPRPQPTSKRKGIWHD